MTEIQKVKAEIKMLEKKLSFLEELEKTKSPVEEAFKDWMGVYPPTNPSVDNIFDIRWRAFQMGYNAAYEEKVAQEPEQEPEMLLNSLQGTMATIDPYSVKKEAIDEYRMDTIEERLTRIEDKVDLLITQLKIEFYKK